MARRGTTRPWASAAGQTISVEARWYDDTNTRRSKRFRVEQPGDGRSERRAQAAAEAELDRISADKQRGDYLDPRAGKVRFADVAEDWLAVKVKRPKTLAGYESLLRTHLLPTFGNRAVGSIRTTDVRRWLADMQRKGCAAGTIRNAYRVLTPILDSAVENRYLAANPCGPLKRDDFPKLRRAPMLFLDAEQVARLAAEVPAPYDVLVHFAARSGMRAGEIGALRMENVDLLRKVVHVRESLSEVAGAVHFLPPKTGEERAVVLSSTLARMLRDYLAAQPQKGPRDFLFTAPGNPTAPVRHGGWFYGKVFKPAARRASLSPKLRFHDLRHTCASLLIAENVPAKAIQEHLGHSSYAITMDRYGHLYPAATDDVREALERAFG